MGIAESTIEDDLDSRERDHVAANGGFKWPALERALAANKALPEIEFHRNITDAEWKTITDAEWKNISTVIGNTTTQWVGPPTAKLYNNGKDDKLINDIVDTITGADSPVAFFFGEDIVVFVSGKKGALECRKMPVK